MQQIRITQYGGPEQMRLVELPDPIPAPGEALVRVTVAGVNFMDTAAFDAAARLGAARRHGRGGRGPRRGRRRRHREPRAGRPGRLVLPPGQLRRPRRGPGRVPRQDPRGGRRSDRRRGDDAGPDRPSPGHRDLPGRSRRHRRGAGGRERRGTAAHPDGQGYGRPRHRPGLPSGQGARGPGHGADHVLVSSRGGFQDQVRELTGGRGTDVVYDGGGTDTFRSSQLALRRHGVHAFLGNLIGNPTLNPTDLPASIKLTYPVVFDHVPDPAPLRRRAGEVFDLVAAGILRPRIGARYPLADAAKAHADLASRRTVGKLLLLP